MIDSETDIVHSVGEIKPGQIVGIQLQVAAEKTSRDLALGVEAELGLSLRDQAQLILAMERRNDSVARLPVSELREDAYQVPGLNELIHGGGQCWMPLFDAQRARELRAEDDFQALGERGFTQSLIEREPLPQLIAAISALQKGEGGELQAQQVLIKQMSVRVHEMTIIRTMIEEAQAQGNQSLVDRLSHGIDAEALIAFGNEAGLLRPSECQGGIESDEVQLRARNTEPTQLLTATLRKYEGRLGSMIKKGKVPIHNSTFLPHINPAYGQMFGRYTRAKLSAPSASPVMAGQAPSK